MSLYHEMNVPSYKINQYLSLKLENNQTVIYINGKKFSGCRYLIINIDSDEIPSYDDYKSINEIIDDLHEFGHRTTGRLTPKEAFKGHCSNLQAWYENDYNTDILDIRLSFPLLRLLSKEGDKKAIRQFKEEIIHKFKSQYLPTIQFLTKGHYGTYFTQLDLELLQREIIDNWKIKDKIAYKYIVRYITQRLYYLKSKKYKGKRKKRRITKLKLKMLEIGCDLYQLKITVFL